MSKQIIYLDNAATTRMDAEVLEALQPYMRGSYGNPSSRHLLGAEIRRAVEAAREQCAGLLETRPERIVFTASGSEANNLAIKGMMGALRSRNVLTTPLEHPSVVEPLKALSKHGFTIDTLPVDARGVLNTAVLQEMLDQKEYGLFCLIHGSNEVGTLQPINQIIHILQQKSPGTWLHLDAVQTVGHVSLEPKAWGIHSLTLSSHKIHGPAGAGLLALYRDVELKPLVAGGGQEGGRRSGTENVPAIVGTARALDRTLAALPDAAPRMTRLRDQLAREISEKIPDTKVNGYPAQGLPHILSVSFSGLLGEVLLHHLEKEGIMVSTGSACHAKWKEIPPTLKVLGLPARLARGTIRFSLSRYTTGEEIASTCRILARQVAYLREVGT